MNFKKRVNGSWTDTPHYIHNTSTDTITTLPAIIYPNDTTATVGLKGNMSQNGTPTPQNPIQPSECGDRTRNLLNVSDFTILANSSNYSIELYNDTFPAGRYTLSLYQNDVLTSSTRNTLRVYANSTVYYENTGENYHNQSGLHSLTFTINEESVVRLEMWGHTLSNDCAYSNIMLNTGSTPLPYEPYGYKIPISSASTTTPVYLGEVQTTRKIKKYEFTGQENLTFYSGSPSGIGAYFRFTDMMSNAREKGVCSHFNPISAPAQANSDSVTFGVANNVVYFMFSTATATALDLTDIQSITQWFAYQYLAGTPVCVWYVLATETTGIVNEPLMKIGDYADTVSGITIPTIAGADSFDVLTTLKPSEVTANYHGWHPVSSAHERRGGSWD